MKVYYDSNGDGTADTELTGIIAYPVPQSRLDIIGFCSLVVRDRNGSLYNTFKTLNFIACRVEDDSSNIIFRGYITKKLYNHDQMTLHMKGIGVVLEWKPFTNNYIHAQGQVAVVPAGASMTLKDSDDGDPFTWAADQWHQGGQNKALLIVDNTGTTISKVWDSSAIAVTGEDAQVGNNASTLSKNDADELQLHENGASIDVAVEFTIDGDVFPTTTFLQYIEVDYKISNRLDAADFIDVWTRLQIKKDTSWVTIKSMGNFIDGIPVPADITFPYDVPPNGERIRIGGSNITLAKYLDNDGGGNYDSLKGLRIICTGSQGTPAIEDFYLHVDYISVEVFYNTSNISPLMKQITDNGASTITVSGVADWSTTGVSEDDSFFIGENTQKVISDLSSQMLTPTGAVLTIEVLSTLTKYIARWFKGNFGIEVLRSILLIEGLHFFEDYVNNRIVLVTEADFVSSSVSLTEANYEWGWEYEDDCNNFFRVEVYGAASLGIYAYAKDDSVDSPMVKEIIDETIMTIPDAQAVADTQLAKWKVKRESIRIPLDGVNTALTVGKTVQLTMARPTVAIDTYPIRMVERRKRGKTGIETTIYCGLGHSKIEEEIGSKIRKALYDAHKAMTDRLISTPHSAGAIITWTDIGGRESGAVAAVNATGLSLAATKVITSADENLGFTFGRTQIGIPSYGDYAIFAHRDLVGVGQACLTQSNSGNSSLNASAGSHIFFTSNGSIKMDMVSTSLIMSIPIAMGTNKITGCGDPVAAQDVATKIYVDNSPINQMFMSGSDGFVIARSYGATYAVAFSDVDAAVLSTFYVGNGGSFKVSIIHSGTGNNFGKTAGGVINISYDVAEGLETWNLGAQDFNLPLEDIRYLKIPQFGTAFTVANNSKVGVSWAKDDNAGGAAGTFNIYGMILTRQ